MSSGMRDAYSGRMFGAQKGHAPAPERDNCQVCKGFRGGTPGNENIIEGVTMCDYCHGTYLRLRELLPGLSELTLDTLECVKDTLIAHYHEDDREAFEVARKIVTEILGIPIEHDPLQYHRETYGVPAAKGVRVTWRGKEGRIVGASGPHVLVQITEDSEDGRFPIRPMHPTDPDLVYVDPEEERDDA